MGMTDEGLGSKKEKLSKLSAGQHRCDLTTQVLGYVLIIQCNGESFPEY